MFLSLSDRQHISQSLSAVSVPAPILRDWSPKGEAGTLRLLLLLGHRWAFTLGIAAAIGLHAHPRVNQRSRKSINSLWKEMVPGKLISFKKRSSLCSLRNASLLNKRKYNNFLRNIPISFINIFLSTFTAHNNKKERMKIWAVKGKMFIIQFLLIKTQPFKRRESSGCVLMSRV